MMGYHFSPPRFDHAPEGIDAATKAERATLEHAIDAIAKLPPEKATFRDTVLALESASTIFSNNLNAPLFLKYVSTDDRVRAAADRCETTVQQMIVDLFVREDLFRALKACKDGGEKLGPVDAYLLDEYLTLFRRNGLDLAPEKRATFVEKKKRLVAIEAEYAKRLVEWDDFLVLTREELDGMPQPYIDSLPCLPDGRYKVTLAYPHMNPFLENSPNAKARAELELKYLTKGGDRNRELLEEALRIRDELAKLLGYETHAHFVLERRMAKKPEQVTRFLDRLREKLIPKGREDLRALLALKREETGDPAASEVLSHEWRYYENLLKKRKFQVDTQAIKEYFPLDVVLKGMFDIYQTLLGVTLVKQDGPIWHDSVEMFRVERQGQAVAYFYMDLFPREGKYGHAAAFTLVSGYARSNGDYEVPVSAIVANFNPPTAGTPSLLEHSEVETLFHEFGHIMHQVLTSARYGTFSGTNVKTDFVEAPSQMLENWVWEKESLGRLSGHYKTPSKKLPPEMLDNLLRAKLLNVGIRYLRQLSFATIDMTYHTRPDLDSTEVYRRCSRDIMLIPIPEGAQPQAGFGHIMGGYDAGYYGYLWSEVYAQDMFTRFEKEGMFNARTGADYLDWILKPGGEQDPSSLLRGFLGREPNEEAFLRSLGL